MYGTLADIRVVLRINLANLVSAYSIHGLLGNPMLLIFAAVDYATALQPPDQGSTTFLGGTWTSHLESTVEFWHYLESRKHPKSTGQVGMEVKTCQRSFVKSMVLYLFWRGGIKNNVFDT